MSSTRTVLMKLCLSCLVHMSDDQLAQVIPLLTSIAPETPGPSSGADELETRVFACLDASGI